LVKLKTTGEYNVAVGCKKPLDIIM